MILRRMLPAMAAAVFAAIVLAQAAAATTTTAQTVPVVSGKPITGSPVFVSFTNTFNPDLSTTVFQVVAQSTDGSQLAYNWTLSAPCGALTAPGADQPSNGYFHGPTPQLPNGCPPPPGAEALTTITVDVFRAQDKGANGRPNPGSPYFEYYMYARAQDESATAGMATGAQLDYFGSQPPATPARTATPTATATTISGSPTGSTSSGASWWWIVVGVFVVLVVAVGAWIFTHQRPPVALVGTTTGKCDEEEAAVQAAKAALKAAQDRFAPVDAARTRLEAAQRLNDEKTAESLKQNRAAGAQMGHASGSTPEGKTIDRTTWSYKNPSLKPAAEKARADADAAAAALATAQKAFDGLGGQAAWNAAHNAVTDALAKLDAAQTALAKCMGIGEPPVAPPTTTDGGGAAAGGPSVATGGDGPTTQEKPGCKEGEVKTTEICRGTVSENSIGSLKLLPSGWFESGDGVREILNKFRQVDAAIDMASKVKDAFTNPVGSIVDSIQRAGQMMNKLPPSPPGSYQDAMKGALVDGIEDLTHKLDTFHGQVSELQAAWPVNTYEYVGTLTCTCTGGKLVASRSFTVTHKSGPTVQTRALTSGGSSGLITADDVSRMTGILLRQLVAANNSAEQTLYAMQKKLDEAACQ